MATIATDSAAGRQVGNSYYTLTALMLALGLVAFSDNFLTDIGQPSNQQPSMVIHGLFALAWMILLVVQANHVRKDNLSALRRLGPFVFAVGAGMVIPTTTCLPLRSVILSVPSNRACRRFVRYRS